MATNNEAKLQGNMGTGELVMSVLAFSGPLVCVSGFATVYYPMVGSGVPWLYIISGIILTFFTVGFSKMGTVMTRPGGFYAYITEGLGRNVGLSAAFLATLGYTLIGLYGPPLFAIFMDNVMAIFNGPSIPWWIWGIGVVLCTWALAYRRIDLSAKVLFWVMLFECALIVLFDICSFATGHGAEAGGTMFHFPNLEIGGFGAALLLAFGNFFGFEATVIYREECKNPEKTIPRATFIAVIGIAVFYAIASWALVAYYGADGVVDAANAGSDTMFQIALGNMTFKVIQDVVTIVAATSTFASILSLHNVAARYFYNLGTDAILPKKLGAVHKKHKSPYIAASLVGIFWVIMLTIFAISGKDPNFLYPLFSGSGTFMVTMVLFLAGIAVFAYFAKDNHGFNLFITKIAPILGFLGIGALLIVSVMNFDTLTGATGIISIIMMIAYIAYAFVAFFYAKHLKKTKPEVWEKIGRQNFTD